MDSLAETRLVRVQLNLIHPAQPAFNLVRVREIAADSTPLPHAPFTMRHLLDTVVSADSAVTVILGPGRATLLRIIHLTPDTLIRQGSLMPDGGGTMRYPDQRHEVSRTSSSMIMKGIMPGFLHRLFSSVSDRNPRSSIPNPLTYNFQPLTSNI
jgi:hypothetical protein